MKIIPPLYPVRDKVYTLEQIINSLTLDDTPCLSFTYQGKETVIQDSHLSLEDLLTVPGASDSKWKYLRTTNEWIPVFEAVDDEAVLTFVDVVEELDPTQIPEDLGWWATPKGFPRQQYYETYTGE